MRKEPRSLFYRWIIWPAELSYDGVELDTTVWIPHNSLEAAEKFRQRLEEQTQLKYKTVKVHADTLAEVRRTLFVVWPGSKAYDPVSLRGEGKAEIHDTHQKAERERKGYAFPNEFEIIEIDAKTYEEVTI